VSQIRICAKETHVDLSNRSDDDDCVYSTYRRPGGRAAVFLLAVASAACANPEVTGPPGSQPSGSGPSGTSGAGGSGGAQSAPPSFVLPDAGAVQTTPPAAPGPDRQCAGDVHQAEVVPLDLLLLVDASSSMDQPAGMRSKWETAQSALSSFIRDPSSSGLGIGLQFFPNVVTRSCTADQDCSTGFTCRGRTACGGPSVAMPGPVCRSGGILLPPTVCPAGTMCVPAGACSVNGALCTNIGRACPAAAGTCVASPRTCVSNSLFGGAECDPLGYQAPAVPIGTLPAAEMPLLAALNAKDPTGGTPMGPAVRGALGQLRAHLQVNPGRKAVLVLASDGVPAAFCPMNEIADIAANLGAAFMGPPSIPTYVIGVFSQAELAMSQAQLDQLAMAGGSTKAFVLAATNDLTQRLQEALNQIRGAALACEYQIPAPTVGSIDFTKVNVRYTGGGTSENIPYVERADRCDPTRGGWYYDVAPGTGVPTRILTCDATCRRFRTDQAGKVELVFGCGTQVIN
jgi:hypothetical protein